MENIHRAFLLRKAIVLKNKVMGFPIGFCSSCNFKINHTLSLKQMSKCRYLAFISNSKKIPIKIQNDIEIFGNIW